MALFAKKNKKKEEEEINAKDLEGLEEQKRQTVATNILNKIKELDAEIAQRNEAMNERDSLLNDSEYILEDLDIKPGSFITKYNVLNRAVEIHSTQTMGRGFNVIARYDKQDPSLNPERAEEIELKNESISTKAQNAKSTCDAVMRDNGGIEPFKIMSMVGSAYGTGLIKKWIDWDTKNVKVVAVESVQNYRAGWSDDNFRERDFDAMVYQISLDKANKAYAKKSGIDEFTADEKKDIQDTLTKQSSRPMVTVIDFVGTMPGINNQEPFMAKIVGGHLVGYETRPQFMPKFYIFPNKVALRRPWGKSDISDEAIDANKTYIQKASDYDTLINKTLFTKYKARNFTDADVPKAEAREVQVFPMGADQDIDPITVNQTTYPFKDTLAECKENLFRLLGLGRVFMDDPTISFESSQALMTGMKPTIDVAEDKQTRWTQTLVELFEDILEDVKSLDPKLKDSIGEEYRIDIEWPSVLRKDDASFTTTQFNDVSRGFMSLETYLEKRGCTNVSEEMDRIKGNMSDPILGAVVSGNARMISQLQLQQQMMAQQPNQQGGNPTNAPLSTDQNSGNQPASAPGSGAPAVSAQGAINTQQQNQGV